MNVLRKISLLLPLLVVSLLPLVALGTTHTDIGTTPDVGITDLAGVNTALDNVFAILQTALFALVAIFVVIAAFQYLTAQGDPEKTKTAKNMIIYAIVALGIALIAGGVKGIVANILTGIS